MNSGRLVVFAARIGFSALVFVATGSFGAENPGETHRIATSQPAVEATRSPAEQLAAWQDDFDRWTPEQGMSAYAAHNDVETAMARGMALNSVMEQRLVRLARERWGEKAEIEIAHACGADCRADDDTADVEVHGDHATIKYQSADIPGLSLVRDNGVWKIDVSDFSALDAEKIAAFTRAMDQAAQITDQAEKDVRAGKYASADDLAKYMREQIAALGLK